MRRGILVLAFIVFGIRAQAQEEQLIVEYQRESAYGMDGDHETRHLWREGRHRLRIQYPRRADGATTLTITSGPHVYSETSHSDRAERTRSENPTGEAHAYLLDQEDSEERIPLEIGNEIEFFKARAARREANVRLLTGECIVYSLKLDPYDLKLYVDLDSGRPRQLTVQKSHEEYSIRYHKYERGMHLFDSRWLVSLPSPPSKARAARIARRTGRGQSGIGGNGLRVTRVMSSVDTFLNDSAMATKEDPNGLGAAHERAGNFGKSLSIFRGGSKAKVPPFLFHIAWQEFFRGNYLEGGKIISSHAKEFFLETTPANGEAYRAAALAEMYRFNGDDTRALYYYYQATRGPFAEATFQIASIYLNQGHYMAAQRQYERLREHKTGPSAAPLSLIGTGLLALKHGYYGIGRSYFEQALRSAEDAGANYPKALALEHLSRASLLMLDFAAAETGLRDAFSFQQSLGMTGRSAQLAMGDLFMKTGRLDQAFVIYEREHAGVSLAGWYFAAGRYGEARRQIELMLPKAEAVHYSDARFALYTISGLIEEKEGDPEKAAFWFKKACDLGERLRNTTGFPLNVERYGIGGLEPYEGMVRTSPAGAGGFARSFTYSEQTKARVFSRIARSIGYEEFFGLPDVKPLWMLKALKKYPLRAEEEQLENPLGSNGTKTAEEFLEDNRKLKAAFAEYQTAIGSVLSSYPEYGERILPAQLAPADLRLRPRERLIEFEVTALDTRVFVVSTGELLHAYRIDLTREQLRTEIDDYRLFFNNVKDGRDLARYDYALSARLYDILLRPAFEARSADGALLIPSNSEVIIVPDEFLGAVSFESLVTRQPKAMIMPSTRYGPTPTGLRYLGDDYDLAYQHSATSLLALRRAAWAPTRRKLFALADPIFGRADPRSRPVPAAIASGGAVRTMGAGGTREGSLPTKTPGAAKEGFPRLDRTSLLAEKLRTSIFPGDDVVIHQGAEASEKKLRQVDLSSFTYLLFATHGILDDTLPGVKEPALVLNQVGNEAGDDGYLTESKVMKLKLNAEIVALTACSTGLGKSLSGEGMMGLGRAFQLAGAKNVLVSLWNVSEDSTSILAEQFFRRVKNGASPRVALRLARQDVRRQGYEHPFYWAPFVLYGN